MLLTLYSTDTMSLQKKSTETRLFSPIIALLREKHEWTSRGAEVTFSNRPPSAPFILIGQMRGFHGDTVATVCAPRPFYQIWSVSAPFVASDWWRFFLPSSFWEVVIENLSLFFQARKLKVLAPEKLVCFDLFKIFTNIYKKRRAWAAANGRQLDKQQIRDADTVRRRSLLL